MRHIKKTIFFIIDFLFSPIIFLIIKWLHFARVTNFKYQGITKKILKKLGVLPVIDHYYEPLINPSHLLKPLNEDRKLPGIEINNQKQLEILKKFKFQKELIEIPYTNNGNKFKFAYSNLSFPSGDSEIYYSMLRLYKPKMIIEIGSGQSTLLALEAIKMNKIENPTYNCKLICIEPYEYNWLEEIGVDVIRKRVETLNTDFFSCLEKDDFLFIDSSHVIRPQGDVTFEILDILPKINKGVLVHFHDIFTPKDYIEEWVFAQRLWNEQYLLEAFLSCNNEFEIVLASNHLFHTNKELLLDKCPVLKKDLITNPIREVGSFWIRRK